MHNNRHMQRHRLHHELKRNLAVDADLDRRQSGWDRFTNGFNDFIADLKAPFAGPKTSETPTSTQSSVPTRRPLPSDDDDDDVTTKPTPKTTPTPTPAQKTPTSLNRAATTSSVQRSSVGLPASVLPTSLSDPLPETSLAIATDKPTLPLSSVPLETTTSSTLSPAQTSAAAVNAEAQRADQEATSTAAKAGIAFGVIGGVLVIFMIIWFIMKQRRDQLERQRLDDERFNDEKFNRDFASQSASNAPATPLAAGAIATDRPKTANSNQEKQLPVFPKNTEDAWERPVTGNSSHPSNPFGNHAETLDRPVSPLSDIGVATSRAPVSPALSVAAPAAAVAGGAVAGAAAVGALSRKASLRKDLPRPPDLTLDTPSAAPVDALHSGASSPGGAAIAAAGGPPTSTVHRVQLDFQPTMEDELELKAGELIRLLFEYDDGWALCIRLDRSKQGVVPRTCLSARPVKPRPGPGRPGPQQQQPVSRGPGSIGRKPVPGQAY